MILTFESKKSWVPQFINLSHPLMFWDSISLDQIHHFSLLTPKFEFSAFEFHFLYQPCFLPSLLTMIFWSFLPWFQVESPFLLYIFLILLSIEKFCPLVVQFLVKVKGLLFQVHSWLTPDSKFEKYKFALKLSFIPQLFVKLIDLAPIQAFQDILWRSFSILQ